MVGRAIFKGAGWRRKGKGAVGERLGFSGWSPDGSLGMAGHLWDILRGSMSLAWLSGGQWGLRLQEDEYAPVFVFVLILQPRMGGPLE